MDQQHHIGLDVSVKETAICIVDPHGKVVHHAIVESHPELISSGTWTDFKRLRAVFPFESCRTVCDPIISIKTT